MNRVENNALNYCSNKERVDEDKKMREESTIDDYKQNNVSLEDSEESLTYYSPPDDDVVREYNYNKNNNHNESNRNLSNNGEVNNEAVQGSNVSVNTSNTATSSAQTIHTSISNNIGISDTNNDAVISTKKDHNPSEMINEIGKLDEQKNSVRQKVSISTNAALKGEQEMYEEEEEEEWEEEEEESQYEYFTEYAETSATDESNDDADDDDLDSNNDETKRYNDRNDTVEYKNKTMQKKEKQKNVFNKNKNDARRWRQNVLHTDNRDLPNSKATIADVEVNSKRADMMDKQNAKYFAVLWSRQRNDFQTEPLSFSPGNNNVNSLSFLYSFSLNRTVILRRNYNAMVEHYLSAPHLRHAMSIFLSTLPIIEQRERTTATELAFAKAVNSRHIWESMGYSIDNNNSNNNNSNNNNVSSSNINNIHRLRSSSDTSWQKWVEELNKRCELQHNTRFHGLHENILNEEYTSSSQAQDKALFNQKLYGKHISQHDLLPNVANQMPSMLSQCTAPLQFEVRKTTNMNLEEHECLFDDPNNVQLSAYYTHCDMYEWCRSDIELMMKDIARLRRCNDDTIPWREIDFAETDLPLDMIESHSLERNHGHGIFYEVYNTYKNNDGKQETNFSELTNSSNSNVNSVNDQNNRNHATPTSSATHCLSGGSVDCLIEVLLLTECDEPYINGIAECNFTNTFLTLSSLFITADVLITKFIRFFRSVWGWVIHLESQGVKENEEQQQEQLTRSKINDTAMLLSSAASSVSAGRIKSLRTTNVQQNTTVENNTQRSLLIERGHYLMSRALKCLMAFCRSHETDLTLGMFQQLSYFLMTCGVHSPMYLLNESPEDIFMWPCTHGIHSLRRYYPWSFTSETQEIFTHRKVESMNLYNNTSDNVNGRSCSNSNYYKNNDSCLTPLSPLSPFTSSYRGNITLGNKANDETNQTSFSLRRQGSSMHHGQSAFTLLSRHGSRKKCIANAEHYNSGSSVMLNSSNSAWGLESTGNTHNHNNNNNSNVIHHHSKNGRIFANLITHKYCGLPLRRGQVPKIIARMHKLFQEQYEWEKVKFTNSSSNNNDSSINKSNSSLRYLCSASSMLPEEVTEILSEFAQYLQEIIHKHYQRISVRLPWTTANHLEHIMDKSHFLWGDISIIDDNNNNSSSNNNNIFEESSSSEEEEFTSKERGTSNNFSNSKSKQIIAEERSKLRSKMREVHTIVDTGAKRDRQSNVDIARLIMEHTHTSMNAKAACEHTHSQEPYHSHRSKPMSHIISGNSYMLVSGLRSRRNMHNTQVSVMPSNYWVRCDNQPCELSTAPLGSRYSTNTMTLSSDEASNYLANNTSYGITNNSSSSSNNNNMKEQQRLLESKQALNRSAMSDNSFTLFVHNTYSNACNHTLRPFDMDAQQFVHQLCLLSFYLFAEIPVRELFNNTWNNSEMQRCVPFHLTEMVAYSIRFQLWVVAVIVAQPQWRDSRRALHHFLDVCRVLYDVQNYEMASVLLNGLCHPTVQYLERLYVEIHHQEMLTPSAQRQRETLQELMDPFAPYSPSSLHSVTARTAGDMETPLIPVISPILSTLDQFEKSKGPTLLRRSRDGETLVNWTKISAIGSFVNLWLRCQLIPYTYPIDPILQEYLWSIRENTWNDEMLQEMARRPKRQG